MESTMGGTTTDGSAPRWATVDITRVEDLQDAVYGAGLEAIQYSRGTLTGTLAVTEHRDTVFTVAEFGGRIGIRGPLSRDRITLAIGLSMPEGSRQWMREVHTGDVGAFMPDDEHDGLHAAGAAYVAMALSRATLEEIAEEMDLVLDDRAVHTSGIHPRRLPVKAVESLVRGFAVGEEARPASSVEPCDRALHLAVAHFARPPRRDLLRGPSDEYARIVDRARDYVMAHLHRSINVEEMARAAFASQRTLYRAFRSVLGESPASFVRRIRLHRIRKGLAPREEIACTVSRVAYRNGMMQLGRMARWYREVFGELPSETLAEVQAGRARRRVVEVVREKGLVEALAP